MVWKATTILRGEIFPLNSGLEKVQ